MQQIHSFIVLFKKTYGNDQDKRAGSPDRAGRNDNAPCTAKTKPVPS